MERLQAISDMIIRDEPTADIGADHALLSLLLIKKDIVPRIIATELTDGPYQRLRLAVRESLYKERIEVRQGNGLQVLEPEEVKNVIIAGMGGDTIVDILTYDWQKANSYNRYVFQPMSRARVLRHCLSLHGWPILDEKLIRENERFFIIISSCPGNSPYELSDLEMEVGPLILRNDDDLKIEYLESYLKKYFRIYNSLLHSKRMEKPLLENCEKIIKELEGILNAGKG